MKCPRSKFQSLDYTRDLELQKQEICKACSDYNGKDWNQHCSASLKCMFCGSNIDQSYFFKIAADQRATITHGICDNCRRKRDDLIKQQQQEKGRYLW